MFWKINILSVNISTKLFLPTIFNNLFTLSTDSHTYNTRCFNLGCLMVPPPYIFYQLSASVKKKRGSFLLYHRACYCTFVLLYYSMIIFIYYIFFYWYKCYYNHGGNMWDRLQQNFNFSFSAVTASIKKTFGLGGRLCTSL